MMLSQVIRSQEAFKKSIDDAAAALAAKKKKAAEARKSSQKNEPPEEGKTKTVGIELTAALYKRLRALQTRRKLPSLKMTCLMAIDDGLRRAGL